MTAKSFALSSATLVVLYLKMLSPSSQLFNFEILLNLSDIFSESFKGVLHSHRYQSSLTVSLLERKQMRMCLKTLCCSFWDSSAETQSCVHLNLQEFLLMTVRSTQAQPSSLKHSCFDFSNLMFGGSCWHDLLQVPSWCSHVICYHSRALLMSSSCFIKLSVITRHWGLWGEFTRPPSTGEK